MYSFLLAQAVEHHNLHRRIALKILSLVGVSPERIRLRLTEHPGERGTVIRQRPAPGRKVDLTDPNQRIELQVADASLMHMLPHEHHQALLSSKQGKEALEEIARSGATHRLVGLRGGGIAMPGRRWPAPSPGSIWTRANRSPGPNCSATWCSHARTRRPAITCPSPRTTTSRASRSWMTTPRVRRSTST